MTRATDPTPSGAQNPSCASETEVLAVERRETWRRRLRQRLPFFSLPRFEADGAVLEWIEAVLSIGASIGDSDTRKEAASAVRSRCKELRQALTSLRARKPPPAGLDHERVAEIDRALEALERIRANNRLFTARPVGLALSGGGIRSASFGLGVLESLNESDELGRIDYLSSVSGGGYTASAWTFHACRDQCDFPFSRNPHDVRDSERVDWIRAHGSYLNSGREVNSLTLAASLVRGIGLNLLFVVPLFFAFMWLATLGCHDAWGWLVCSGPNKVLREPLPLLLALLAAVTAFYGFQRAMDRRVPADLRVRLGTLVVVWVAAAGAVAIFTLAPESWRSLTAQALILGPLAGLAVWSILWSAIPSRGEVHQRTPRIRILLTETLAWIVVGAVIYLLLQELPLGAPHPFLLLVAFVLGAVLLVKMVVNVIFMALLSFHSTLDADEQRALSVQYGDLLGVGLVLVGLGALPLIDRLITAVWAAHAEQFLSGLTVTGVISTAAGWLRRGAGHERRGYVAFLLRFGVSVLVVAGLLWMYRLGLGAHGPGPPWSVWDWVFVIGLGLVWVLAAFVTDINYMSMHRYYRNRLADAFLVEPSRVRVLDAAARHKVWLSPDAASYLSQKKSPEQVEHFFASATRQVGLAQTLAWFDDPAYEAMKRRRLPDDVTAFVAARIGMSPVLREKAARKVRARFRWRRRRAGAIDLVEHLAQRLRSKLTPNAKKTERRARRSDGAVPNIDDARRALEDLGVRGVGLAMEETLRLKDVDVGRSGSPYHLINTNLVLPGSRSEKYRLRRGDSFVFSPRFVGSGATGWASTAHGNMKIGTAMAISGAAVDPNTGVALSMPLRIVMTLLNVRLGYWWRWPGALAKTWVRRLWAESWPVLVVREMFGMMHENSAYVRLSDGGHFENLGLYELVRRRCGLIIVCDAAADKDFGFGDLARAIERVRVDFGATIDIDTTELHPRGDPKRSVSPFVKGQIIYDDGKSGDLILIKSTLFVRLAAEDVLGYARAHDKFPDESTADQFFTEEQFEAYRELGYYAAQAAVRAW